MYQEIIDKLKKLAEPDFANWLRPFLSITEDSKEELWGIRVPKLRKLAKEYKNPIPKGDSREKTKRSFIIA